MKEYIKSRPKPTNGHQLGTFLQCKRKAWLNYFGHEALKADTPPHQQHLMDEGLRFEDDIFEMYYPEAYEVKGDNFAIRKALTLDAMRRGEPVILQAQLGDGTTTVGVADILILEDTDEQLPLGHAYSLGEVKHSAQVAVSHLTQLLWYASMLAVDQQKTYDHSFVIIKNKEQIKVQLTEVRGIYEECLEGLLPLRDLSWEELGEQHPIVYKKSCNKCQWRYACIPELMQQENHLSVIPLLNAHHIMALKAENVNGPTALLQAPAQLFANIGFSFLEYRRLIFQVQTYHRLGFGFKEKIQSLYFGSLTPFVLDYDDQEPERPIALRTAEKTIPLEMTAYPEFVGRWIGYGLDALRLQQWTKGWSDDQIEVVNLAEVIEKQLFGLFPGYALNELYYFFQQQISIEQLVLDPDKDLDRLEKLNFLIQTIEEALHD
ncbi:hypothetical protein [Persicobacter psychrovividus]|uniref:DUF2779 domain-containing protein n=1 Tax=Persicobacter psychrovividus TaxID=387638 RepID=A0ABM7VKU3_9BACT|nr:hypothetical protein PEPS_39090 [Persicobacter psychrovividus]